MCETSGGLQAPSSQYISTARNRDHSSGEKIRHNHHIHNHHFHNHHIHNHLGDDACRDVYSSLLNDIPHVIGRDHVSYGQIGRIHHRQPEVLHLSNRLVQRLPQASWLASL